MGDGTDVEGGDAGLGLPEPVTQARWQRRLARTLAKIRLKTRLTIVGVLIAATLYYLSDAASDLLKRSLPAFGALLVLLAVVAYLAEKKLEHLAKHWLDRPVRERIGQVGQLAGEAHEISLQQKLFEYVPRGIDHIFGLRGTAIYVLNGVHFELVGAIDGVPGWLDADDPLLLQVKRDLSWRRAGAAGVRSNIRSPLVWPIEHGDRLVGLLLAGDACDDLPRFVEAEEADAVSRSLCDLLAMAMQHANPLGAKGAIFLDRAERLASAVTNWFNEQFALLTSCAACKALTNNDVEPMAAQLQSLVQQLDPAFSGAYVLNQDGVMLDHAAPPEVQIRGKPFGHRSYFRDCVEQMAPVVCDMLDTADRRVRNRPVEILVLAVPRWDAHGNFLGILDAVVDLPRDPFSSLALQARDAEPLIDRPRISGIRVVLIDSVAIVLGKSDARSWAPRASVSGQPTAEQLRRDLRPGQRAHTLENGAIVRVTGTPFFALAYESNDPADRPHS
ncbi:MAG: cache domain-containing protein [Pseudorhodoferax sp.]